MFLKILYAIIVIEVIVVACLLGIQFGMFISAP